MGRAWCTRCTARQGVVLVCTASSKAAVWTLLCGSCPVQLPLRWEDSNVTNNVAFSQKMDGGNSVVGRGARRARCGAYTKGGEVQHICLLIGV